MEPEKPDSAPEPSSDPEPSASADAEAAAASPEPAAEPAEPLTIAAGEGHSELPATASPAVPARRGFGSLRRRPPAAPANPAEHGYSAIAMLPVEAQRNYSVFSLIAGLYIYWITFMVGLLSIVIDDVYDPLGFLVNRYWLAVINLAAVVLGVITLWERRQMSRKGWLPCNHRGLPLGRAAARTGLFFGLVHLVLIIAFIVQGENLES